MIATLEKEYVDFIYDNYPAIHGDITREHIERLIMSYSDKVIVVREKEKIIGMGLYFRLTNKTLKEVQDRILDLAIPENTLFCLRENGNNIHFAFIVGTGKRNIKPILKGVRQVIENERPRSVSWFSPNLEQFFIRHFNFKGR